MNKSPKSNLANAVLVSRIGGEVDIKFLDSSSFFTTGKVSWNVADYNSIQARSLLYLKSHDLIQQIPEVEFG